MKMLFDLIFHSTCLTVNKDCFYAFSNVLLLPHFIDLFYFYKCIEKVKK